jgi:8-oxo-dGTP diphosphatase
MNERVVYVVGLMIEGDRVVLVRKNRPAKWAGRVTGPGGKVELGESLNQAMAREFQEEAGVATDPTDWTLVVSLRTKDFDLHFLKISGPVFSARTTESEQIFVGHTNVLESAMFSNVRWALQLALDDSLQFPIRVYEKGMSPADHPVVQRAVAKAGGKANNLGRVRR